MCSKTKFCENLAIAIVSVVGCLELCGCAHTVQVYGPVAPSIVPGKVSKKPLPGIPFYNHYGVCTQEAVWLEPQTTLTLTVASDVASPQTQTMVLNNEAFYTQDADVATLIASLRTAQTTAHAITDTDKSFCPAAVAKNWLDIGKKFKVIRIDERAPKPSDEPTPKPGDNLKVGSASNQISDSSQISIAKAVDRGILLPVSNTATQGTAVDYTQLFYLNSRSPLIGTASVAANIGSDGTLTQGSVSVDDETLGDVLTAAATIGSGGLTAFSTIRSAKITADAPITNASYHNQILTAPYRGCMAAEGFGPMDATKVTYKFVITVAGMKHDHKLIKRLANSCSAALDDLADGSWSVTTVDQDSKSDDDAIGVKGTITLPKIKDAEPKQ